MQNVFIIHGTGGSPESNWFPWLRDRLEDAGKNVLVPRFPTPDNQSLSNRLEVFESYKSFVNEETIMIGHSLGPAFILNILETLTSPIQSSYMISGFVGLLGLPEYDELNKTFAVKDFDWDKINQNCNKFVVINSDDDPYVPLDRGQELANNLGTELLVLNNAGHINAEFGYTEFEFLLELVKREIS